MTDAKKMEIMAHMICVLLTRRIVDDKLILTYQPNVDLGKQWSKFEENYDWIQKHYYGHNEPIKNGFKRIGLGVKELAKNREQMKTILASATPDDELSIKRWRQVCAYIKKLEKALEQIATGEISGEEMNYKDTLMICRNIAQEALC